AAAQPSGALAVYDAAGWGVAAAPGRKGRRRGRGRRNTMKLSLLTYLMARNWELPKIIEVARSAGFAGIEFRVDARHRHGVELDTTPAQRRAIRDQLQDAYLAVAALGTGCRFDSPDAARRREAVEQT